MSDSGSIGVPRRLGRSVGALFAGLVVGIVLSLGTDIVLHMAGVFPPWGEVMSDGLFVLATVYRTVYSVAGAYVTAMVAPNRPMRHVMILGFIGLAVCTAGMLASWNAGPAFGPRWYSVGLVVMAVPQCWLGGKLWVLRGKGGG